MDEERLKTELRSYLNAEVKKVEPSPDWWTNIIVRLDEQKQTSQSGKPPFWKLRLYLSMVLFSMFLVIVLGTFLPSLLRVSIAPGGGMSPPPPKPPAVVADSYGGAFIFWDDTPHGYSEGLYANHIDAQGNYLWGSKGEKIAEGKVSPPLAITDGADGTIIAWGNNISLYVQKLDSTGNSIWTWVQPHSELELLGMISDGAGGAILIWQDRDEQVYVQRVNAQGVNLWGENGTLIGMIECASFGMPLVSDGAGGAFLVWQRLRGEGIFAQRLDSDGKVLWAEGGVAVTSRTNDTESAQLINDDKGNFIIAWVNIFRGEEFRKDVYVQKLDANGNRSWDEQGILLGRGQDPKLTSDSSGGCIVVWEQGKVFAQRIDAFGETQWQEGGVLVSNVSQSTPSPAFGIVRVISDGGGGSTVIWINDIYTRRGHDTKVFAQKLNPDGQNVWSENGVVAYQNPPFRAVGNSEVANDGFGGFIIGTRVSEGMSLSKTDSVYSQKINSQGNRVWGESGLYIHLKHSSPILPVTASIIMVVVILVLIGVFCRNKLAGVFAVTASVFIGIAALFVNLLFAGPIGYRHPWAYVLNTPINLVSSVIIPIAGLALISLSIWKKVVSKWLMIPILVFCFLVAGVTALTVLV